MTVGLDTEIHRGDRETGPRVTIPVRRGRDGRARWGNHGRPDNELALGIFGEAHEGRAQCDLENGRPLRRIENALGSRPTEPTDRRQRSKKPNVGCLHLEQGTPDMRRRCVDMSPVTLDELVPGNDLVEPRVPRRAHLANRECPREDDKQHSDRDRDSARLRVPRRSRRIGTDNREEPTSAMKRPE